MFSANATRAEIRKLVNSYAPRCQWTYENLPARSTDVIMRHWGPPVPKMSNLRLIRSPPAGLQLMPQKRPGPTCKYQ